jgi:uncharacterized protein YgiM (DUF1202 family)
MNKRILSLIVVVALLAMMLAAYTTTASAAYIVYSKCPNGKALNLRAGPGKDYAVIGKIPYGSEILVVGETSPEWLECTDAGWVQANLTSPYKPGPYVPPAPKPDKNQSSIESVLATAKTVDPYIITLKGTKTSKGVANVRWAPSKKSKLLAAYPEGTEVKVIAELKNWYQVEDLETGAVGYVNTAYVDKY